MTSIAQLKDEVRQELTTNILPFWMSLQDSENGGFYGQMRGDGVLVPDADKGCILNARILWAFSAAYRVVRAPGYLRCATRARDYILNYFVDKEYGGCYWSLDCKGQQKDTKKQFYAIGFVIYGLSEYARATHDEGALTEALSLFDCIEEHALDRQYNGYIEALSRNWQPLEDMRLSELDANYPKSQNTHLHIIEPYTNLLRALREVSGFESRIPQVEKALRNLIDIFLKKILNPETHHLDLFFEMDWTRGAGWLESYGHDIECSWLLHEAALVLGDADVLTQAESIVPLIAKASEKGLNADGSMTHEANLDTGYVDADRHWWVQAENVVGWINIFQYFHDDAALEKALAGWNYIKQHLIDRTHGEWYWSCDAQGKINTTDDHAGFWKCPYHNSRMCLEIMERNF